MISCCISQVLQENLLQIGHKSLKYYGMEYFTAGLCCLVAVCILIFTKYNVVMKLVQRQLHLYKLSSEFEGPPGLPIIGNAHLFIGDTEEIMKTLYKLGESYPTPLPVWISHIHVFFILATPEQFKEVCLSSKAIEKSVLYDFTQPLLGTGLFTAPAAKWRVHRRLIAPTFRTQILRTFVKVFASRAAEMTVRMEQNLNGPEFQLCHYLSQYAVTTVCETTMGVNLDAEIESQKYIEVLDNALESAIKRMTRPWIFPDFIFVRTQLGQDQQKDVKFLKTFTEYVIQNKKTEILERSNQPNLYENENDGSSSMPQQQVFLDHFLNASDGSEALSDEDLRDEVNTLIATGSDTTATTSAFVMLMLASHPEVQEKVYEELCEIHGDHDGEDLNITTENLKRMMYLERVIKETMRLFPIGPYIGRIVTDDLDIGERIIPKGSEVMLGIINVHRNKEYWPDSMRFDPDRFLPEEVAKRHPYAYLPFSAGMRNCIGAKYAMISMMTIIATVIWKYFLKKDNIVPVEDIRLKMEGVLRTVDPISLRIEKRPRRDASVEISGAEESNRERLT